MTSDTATIIRTARERGGLTQEEAAARYGTSQSQWAQWETGHRAPSMAKLAAIVEACGCELRCRVVRRKPQTQEKPRH